MKFYFFAFFLLFANCIVSAQRIERTINSAWWFVSEKHPQDTTLLNLPHTWNVKDAFDDGGKYFRGKGDYGKQLLVPEQWKGKRLFLKFEGANQVTRLWINESLVGEHIGGYTGFVFDITDFVNYGTLNSVRVQCDNSFNKEIPPLGADFTFFGGIYRDVFLMVTEPVHFTVNNSALGRIQVKTPAVSASKAEINISTDVINVSSEKKTYQIRLSVYDNNRKNVWSQTKKISPKKQDSAHVSFDFSISNPLLWSPENPDLYQAEVEIIDSDNKLVDKIHSAFGCRWFHADTQKGFFLNGKHYRLMGVNRHQDFKGLGNALPNELHYEDLKKIKEMGSNFIRLAHYPQDPEVYHWCDQLGIIVWSEIPVVNRITTDEAFSENALRMQKEHVLQFMNHPSVMMWGYMNEILLDLPFDATTTSDEKENYFQSVVRLAQQLNDETKRLDPYRYTVMALHGSQIYNKCGLANVPDIVGWNLYMGWYGGRLEDLGPFLDREHQNYPDRPVLISEYGTGADVRIQTDDPKPWDFSEAYQLKSHSSYVKQVMQRDFVLGMAAWNYADFASAVREDAIPALNQKGLLTYDRKTKDIYYYYQALLLKEPFVYIAGKNRQQRFCDTIIDKKGKVKITVFSNSDSVSVNIDAGKEDSLIPVQNGIAVLDTLLSEGQHAIVARIDGSSFTRNIEVYFKPNLSRRIKSRPLAVNAGSYCDFTDEVTGEVWVSDREYVPGEWGHIGGEPFQKTKGRAQGIGNNILGTSEDPLFQTMQEDIEAYKFDVDPGKYQITLLFTEPLLDNLQRTVYDLGNQNGHQESGQRVFSVEVNKQLLLPDLNLVRDYGKNRAVEISFEVITSGGIDVRFKPVAGSTILSGIKLEAL